MLRVLIIVGSFPSVSETFIANQINALLKHNIELDIYSYEKSEFKGHPNLNKNGLLEKVTFHVNYPLGRKKRLKKIIFWLANHIWSLDYKLLLSILKQPSLYKKNSFFELFYEARWFLIKNRAYKYDVIHAHFGPTGERITDLCNFGFFANSKLVVTFHGYDLPPGIARNFKSHYPNIFKYSNILTVNTPYMEKLILQSEFEINKICTIPMGIDVSFFKKPINFYSSHNIFKILFCGRLIPLKGPDLAIEILEELLHREYENCELDIIGEGPMKAQLQDMIIKKGLSKKVRLLGAKNQNEVKAEMTNSSVFIMPGRRDPETGRAETQGLVIQEAQAMQLPVLVSDVGGMKYGIISGKTGFVLPEKDIEAFVEKIEFLINNKKIAYKIGREGRKFVQKYFDSDLLADKMISLYKE